MSKFSASDLSYTSTDWILDFEVYSHSLSFVALTECRWQLRANFNGVMHKLHLEAVIQISWWKNCFAINLGLFTHFPMLSMFLPERILWDCLTVFTFWSIVFLTRKPLKYIAFLTCLIFLSDWIDITCYLIANILTTNFHIHHGCCVSSEQRGLPWRDLSLLHCFMMLPLGQYRGITASIILYWPW